MTLLVPAAFGSGINEDPVTGSTLQLKPYWSKKLSKQALTAKQVSKRGGEVR